MAKKDCKECLRCELERLKKRVRELENELACERMRIRTPIPYTPYRLYEPWCPDYPPQVAWTTCGTNIKPGDDQSSMVVTN